MEACRVLGLGFRGCGTTDLGSGFGDCRSVGIGLRFWEIFGLRVVSCFEVLVLHLPCILDRAGACGPLCIESSVCPKGVGCIKTLPGGFRLRETQ